MSSLKIKGKPKKKKNGFTNLCCMQLHEQHNGPCTLGSGNSCVMAPYLPSKEPDKFDRVHKVFGVENVYKILSRLEESWQSEYAVNALCYEAEARIHDPIHGYVGPQMIYNNILNNLKREIDSAINELATQDLVVQWYYLREGRSAVRLAGRGRRAQGP
uniref:LOB domain-containing protein n=2 Tax=Brassica oleracea var. oleracea TaxID=109376 RepID=A0A0D3DFG5_BRAOL